MLATAFNLMDAEEITAAVRSRTDVEADALSLQCAWIKFTA